MGIDRDFDRLTDWRERAREAESRVEDLEAALRKLRPYFGKLEPEAKRKDSVTGPGTSPFDAAREAFAVLDGAAVLDQAERPS